MSLFIQLLPSFELWPALLLFILMALAYLYSSRWKYPNAPPGPTGVPILGYFPFVTKQPFVKFKELGKKYGDVFSLNIVGSNVIVLNSYEAIKECFVTKGDHFSGRVLDSKSYFYWITNGLGIAQDEGPGWQIQRRFAVTALRSLGLGKLTLEERIQEIGRQFVKNLEDRNGKPNDPFLFVCNSTINSILYLIADRCYTWEDKDFQLMRHKIHIFMKTLAGLAIFIPMPMRKFLPTRWNAEYQLIKEIKGYLYNVMLEFIKEHEETFDENHLRDYIDAFLKEVKDCERKGGPGTSFTRERLGGTLLNLFFAGSETTSNTLYFGLKVLIQRPDIQEKIQQELDDVIGRERPVSVLDKPNLPYTDAFLAELFRWTTVAPFGFPHANPGPAKLCGYDIPPRSIILANIWAANYDEETFPDPQKFDPERFMDPELKDKRRERVMTFSIGRRSCLGEPLSRLEAYIFLTMILQKFNLRPPVGEDPDMKEGTAFIRVLAPFKLVAEKRQPA